MTEPHDWPFEQSRPGNPAAVVPDGRRIPGRALPRRPGGPASHAGAAGAGRAGKRVRLYQAEEVLSIASRHQQERSILAKTIAAVVSDREASQRYLGNAKTGGSALWLFAPTEDRADQLVGFLADYHYGSLRYYGDKGVKDVYGSTD